MRIVFEMMETVTRGRKETMRWHGNSDVAGHLKTIWRNFKGNDDR